MKPFFSTTYQSNTLFAATSECFEQLPAYARLAAHPNDGAVPVVCAPRAHHLPACHAAHGWQPHCLPAGLEARTVRSRLRLRPHTRMHPHASFHLRSL